MADYELNRIKEAAVRRVAPQWAHLAYDYDQAEYESYLYEVARLEQEERRQPVYSGARTVDLYKQYIGSVYEAGVEYLKEEGPELISLYLDFMPVIGQIKALAEWASCWRSFPKRGESSGQAGQAYVHWRESL
jgi:hypothetical protein